MFNSKKFRQEIESSGLPFSQIDKRIEAAVGLTSKYCRGEREPKVEQLYRFLTAIGYTEEQLKQERLTDWYLLPEATPPA